MHATDALREADRAMTICNACRYCEGLCPVFPAMERRRTFGDGDLRFLANLCHGCGACLPDCQFAPPHEFAVDVPRALARARVESWAAYAWPRALAPLFARNGLAIALIAALSVAGFVAGFVAFNDRAALFAIHEGPGAFYRLMPHGAMVALFGAAFAWAIVAMAMGVILFLRDMGAAPDAVGAPAALGRAAADAATLRHLGGGEGCMNDGERPGDDARRLHHHLVFHGFLLCLASTATATVYHYALGRVAPYAWHDLPVALGTLGGIGLLAGSLGLLAARRRRDPALRDDAARGMDLAFLAMLFLTALTGLALLALRATPAMGSLLALHLGVVFALFLTLPYGRFVHGLHRFVALARDAAERRGGAR